MTSMKDRRQDARTGASAHPSDAASELHASRLAMLRDVKRMSIEERLDLFERLQRDAAWARGARRVR